MTVYLDPTKGVEFPWQLEGGHGSRHPIMNA